eukprot:8984602-Heterocapsa_arctica.AAC.1
MQTKEEAGSEWSAYLETVTARERLVQLVELAREEAKHGATELRESRCQGWAEYCAEQVAAGSGKLYKWIREGSKAFVLPRCDPEWRGTEEQQVDNPPPGLAARQAGIEKT